MGIVRISRISMMWYICIYKIITKISWILIKLIIFKSSKKDKLLKKLLNVFIYLKNWLNIKKNFSAKYLSIK